MAQTKTIQLLRSSALYTPTAASEGVSAKTALENAKAALIALSGRKDGEIVLARYQEEGGEIKSLLGIYHTSPDLGNGQGTGGADVTYTGGWTFLQDITSSTEGLTQLQTEINRIESNVGLGDDGTYTSGYSSDEIVGTPTTLKATVDAIVTFIKGLDKAADAQNGQVVTTVTQVNGAVTETKANVKDLQLGGYSKDTSATGAIASTDTVNTALSKLENTIAKNTVSSNDKTITIDTTGATTDLSVNVDGTTVVKNNSTGVISSGLTLVKITTGLGTNVKEAYQLQDASQTQIGAQIDIYKDSALIEVYLGANTDTINEQTGVITKNTVTDPQSMNFAYQLADGTYSLTKIDVSKFLSESEFGDGLQVSSGVVTVKVGDGIEYGSEASGNKSIKVKIDSTSEKDGQSTPVDFLSVSSGGVKVSGIKDEIDRKIAALDVTDTAVAGQYVSAVNETDGKVSMTRANISEAVLNNYSKGSSADPVAATDTVNAAISKLENQVDAAMDAATAAHTAVEHATGNTHVTVSASQPDSDGKVTYTVNETNIADADDLTAEIAARKAVDGQSGDTYTANANANYISGATSLNNADVLLDTALKTADDAMLTQINGSNAIEVSAKANKQQTVSLKLDTTTTTGNITSDMLEINNNGLMMKNNWDCGTF